MVKTLNSIINRLPPATVMDPSIEPVKRPENIKILTRVARLNCEVPIEIKQQIKQYIANHPGETEKTIIMKALKSYGFTIQEDNLFDGRSRKEA